MKMPNRKYWLAGFLIGGGASIAVACGPDFPMQLLDDRAGNLKETPANTFAYEASHLAPKGDGRLKPVQHALYGYNGQADDDELAAELAKDEAEGLTPAQVALLGTMRQLGNGEKAYAAGADLPQDVRLYTAGAVDFHAGAWKAANARFQAVLALADENRHLRAVWAAYMLGRGYGKLGDIAAAAAAFRKTRDLAIEGEPDPMGLAVSSLGEEAKLHLDRAQALAIDGNLPRTAQGLAEYKQEMAAAVGLYAQQTAYESNRGMQSLRIVADMLINDPVQLAAAIADPTTQKLVVAYALARVDDIPVQENQNEIPDGSRQIRPAVTLNPLIAQLMAALRQNGLDNPPYADRLAALAYRTGQYDLAQKLAEGASSALGDWVLAKIAVQKGDLTAAAAFYSRAAKAFPAANEPKPLDAPAVKLLTGEEGVLALARGEYVMALDRLFAVGGTYWGDAAYIAERVLTVDELKTFIDAKAPPAPVPPAAPKKPATDDDSDDNVYGFRFNMDPVTELRDLLARRLVREGRYQESIAYFHRDGQMRGIPDGLPGIVADYAASLKAPKDGWFGTGRARALYHAAELARHSGMEMMGYEGPPDYFGLDGEFDYGLGQDKPGGPLMTGGELQRFAASAAAPDLRYHYRYIAVQEAMQAADLLPPRSQAFAAVLCNASGWIIDRDPALGKQVYDRYVKEGAHVAWASHFARDCPAPDFDAAAKLKWQLPLRNARHSISSHRWPIGIILALVAAGFVLRRRLARA
jgi:tetratricopeptide (TPR) repeat protein